MEVKRLNVIACGYAPRCGGEVEDKAGEYVRASDLINAIQNPEIAWTGGEKMRVATVNGHRIGFIEKVEADRGVIWYRWDSRYPVTKNRPNKNTPKEAMESVEKAFRDWLAGVIRLV